MTLNAQQIIESRQLFGFSKKKYVLSLSNIYKGQGMQYMEKTYISIKLIKTQKQHVITCRNDLNKPREKIFSLQNFCKFFFGFNIPSAYSGPMLVQIPERTRPLVKSYKN